MPFATVIKHGKTEVVTFHQEGEQGRYPSYYRDKRKYQEGNRIHRLPEHVPECEFDAPGDVFQQLTGAERKILPFDDRFCLFAQVGEERGADDKEDVFEQGEIEQQHDQLQHELPEDEQEIEPAALHLLHPLLQTAFKQHVFDGAVARLHEKINTQQEKRRIDQPRNEDPFPQSVFDDEPVCLEIGLNRCDDLLEHAG